ncbi:MAG TPA: HEAT repeat domain-containing protein [Kofleriaceae bacterium]|nr:HEAT repeat domain-containing protein [Kofleriaceae bacterium]
MHAPVARIRGGKVVSFCSAECAGTAGADDAERRQRAAMPALARPASAGPVPAPAPEQARSRPAPLTPAPPRAEPMRSRPAPPTPAPARAEPVRARAPSSSPPPVPAEVSAAAGERRAHRLPASHEHLAVESGEAVARAPGRGRGVVLAVCALVLAAGVALLVTQVLPLGDAVGDRVGIEEAESPVREPGAAARRAPIAAGARAASPAPSAGAAAETPAPAAAPADDRSRWAAAVAQLRALMDSTSPRVRRLAAQALARTGDGAALTALRALAREEPSELSRIQIAYALARAGDRPAREALRGLLGVERRDVRVDAARCLVQLGDDSGRKALRNMLSVTQHRIGAAGLLARLGDDEGLKVLRAEAADRRATPEAHMRAEVALGRAGDASVKAALHKILADRRYNVGAADALAALGDEAAAPALTAQLDLSAMRVQAALWLRRMKKQVDQGPLVVALENGDEASRVTAAEALLILSGPPALSERD